MNKLLPIIALLFIGCGSDWINPEKPSDNTGGTPPTVYVPIPGPKGESGSNGKNGTDGSNSTPGAPGTNGGGNSDGGSPPIVTDAGTPPTTTDGGTSTCSPGYVYKTDGDRDSDDACFPIDNHCKSKCEHKNNCVKSCHHHHKTKGDEDRCVDEKHHDDSCTKDSEKDSDERDLED